MDYEDDFLFEEDKILTNNVSPLSSLLQFSDSTERTETIHNFVSKTTVPLANVELHHMKMMEDRIPDVELVDEDQLSMSQQHDQMGMTITSGNVLIEKDSSNLIGISIGGGAPLCPCLYIVQVFDNTPAAQDGTLEAGDELVAVNGECLKGKSKVEVAKMIQACDNKVNVIYNKLHADVRQGKTLDIVLKKVKHRLVESLGNSTADALGLSRAILCNDTLVKKLSALEKREDLYKGLVAHAKSVLHAYFDLFQIHKVFGDAFASMGVKEPQPRASEAYTKFGEMHRQMEKLGIDMLKNLKPVLSDLGTYLNKAIPDTRMTISKYADAKFEYLSYCLKVKEMDDEEQSYIALQEPLYRVETGNYEYRLILRCRQNARAKFAKLRADVLVKLELLDNKHTEHIATQLQKFAEGLAEYYTNMSKLLSENVIFPVEIDLSQTTFQHKSPNSVPAYNDEEEEGACGFDPSKILDFEVAQEASPSTFSEPEGSSRSKESKKRSDLSDLVDLSGFADMNEKFEKILLADEKKTETEQLLSIDTKEKDQNIVDELEKLFGSGKKSDLEHIFFQGAQEKATSEKSQPLLSIDEMPSSSSFTGDSKNKTSDPISEFFGEQKRTSESLLFLDEPLIKIGTN